MISTVVAWAAIGGALVGVLFGIAGGILVNLLSDEIKGWMEVAPVAILKVAIRRLPIKVRDDKYEDWHADLVAELRTSESMPISRCFRGIYFAAGLVVAAGVIARDWKRYQPAKTAGRPPNADELVADRLQWIGLDLKEGKVLSIIPKFRSGQLVALTIDQDIPHGESGQLRLTRSITWTSRREGVRVIWRRMFIRD